MNPFLPLRTTRLSRRRMAAALFAGALLASELPVLAGAEAQAFAAAMAEFQQANQGNEAAVGRAVDQLTRLSRVDPADPVLRTYLGAATAMRARTTLLPWKKISHAEEGLAHIDKGLALLAAEHDRPHYRGVAASLEARFTAATTFLAMPSMFNRSERGAKLLDDVVKSALLEGSPLPFKGAVWFKAGTEAAAAGRHAEARQWFDKLVASGAPQAAVAAAKLKEL